MRVGGQIQVRTAGLNGWPRQISAAGRKWAMLVMQEPRNTSWMAVPATLESSLTSSGSFGQARIGSVISFRSISITAAYSAALSAFINDGFLSQASTALMRFLRVLASEQPSAIIFFIRATLD